MQVPVLQIIDIFRNHMPVLYVAFRLRPPSKESVEVPNMQVVVGALFWNFGFTHWMPAAGYTYWAQAQGLCWPRSVRRRSWPWHKNRIYQALNRAMGPGAVGSLATPPTCCQVPAERDMCAYGCICGAAAAAPRPLFIISWCLRATCRRFHPRREECISLSLSLILLVGVAALISHCVLASIFSCVSSTWPSSP